MNDINKILDQLEDLSLYDIECEETCMNAKMAIQYLSKRVVSLQNENQRLKNGTKLILDGVKTLERSLSL